ncbi:MAG: MobA/MobL family protein [Oribacterium sp.]|nr:MobA/MobL family protein [Oribacterium sp.]
MSTYHFHVNPLGRSKGYSAVAAAAYRSGEKLYCDYYGETHDYTKKHGILHTEIMLPDYAPERFKDREALWNELEKQEKHPKAQLCYSFDIALQNELTYEENLALARRFVQEELVSRGMICDIAIHAPGKHGDDIKNPHFHVLSPIRPYLKEGRWGEKQHREYTLDENGDRVRDEKGKYVFNSIPTTDWGSPETLEHWRKRWSEMVNEKFEEKGLSCRIDHRSYKEQGLDLIPQVHEGSAVRRMEARGITTQKGEHNRFVKATNRALKDIISKLKELAEWFKKIKPELNRLSDPTLGNLITEYFDYRNEVAATYTHGVQNAKKSNLQLMAKVIAYVQERKLTTPAELEKRIAYLTDSAEKKQLRINQLKGSVKDYSDKVRNCKALMETREIYEQSQKVFFPTAKKKFQKEHEKELKRYHAASRFFSGMALTDEPQFFLKGWESCLEADREKLSKETDGISVIKAELRQFKEIRKTVDYAIGKRVGEDAELPPIRFYEQGQEAVNTAKSHTADISLSDRLQKGKTEQRKTEESHKRQAEKTQKKNRGVSI